MNLYLTSSGIPEMAVLSGAQRKFVRRECLYPLRQRLSFRGSNMVLTVLAVLFGSYVTDVLSLGFLARVGLLAAIVLAAGWLHDLFWLARWRPEVARFIREHEA